MQQCNYNLCKTQGPTGRGFQTFTGSYLWALDSYKKFVFSPTEPYGIDWTTEFENGTYEHKAEPKHATLAITDTAIQRMVVGISLLLNEYFNIQKRNDFLNYMKDIYNP